MSTHNPDNTQPVRDCTRKLPRNGVAKAGRLRKRRLRMQLSLAEYSFQQFNVPVIKTRHMGDKP